MKNIYFVQAGNLYGSNAYLPYAAGCVAAYAWDNPLIRENYRLGHFTFLRSPLEEVLASFEEPYMVAFSNYLWNYEYHKALAKAIKERWPGCLILFAGHQIRNDSSSQLDENPFIDLLIHGAGEFPFEQLLLALPEGRDLSEVPSLSYRGANGKTLRTKDAVPLKSCDFPSPYLTGLFESLFEQHPKLLFAMTFETNRGCPYRCAFCDWGVAQQGLLRMPMERIRAEIDWAARHKIDFILCADGNFGILERDEEIVDTVVESKLRTGYPGKFNASFAKDSDEIVFRINKKLAEHGLNGGATLSLQAVSPEAQENIGRRNLGFEHYRELISLYRQAGLEVYTDVLVGLPGDTLENFTRGIGEFIAAGMHGSLELYPCEMLQNAAMSTPSYREKHGIASIRVRQVQKFISLESQDDIPEYSDILIQTNTMPVEDWLASFMFGAVVHAFHGLGMLRCLAVYLHWEQRLPYERFYLNLIDYAGTQPSSLLGELLPLFKNRYQAFAQGDGGSIVYSDPRFGDVTWPLTSALFLCAAYESERFYRELPGFLQQYGIDGELLAQLIRWQCAMVCLPGPLPPAQAFAYDFPRYFGAALSEAPPALENKRVTVTFPPQDAPESWVDFARIYVWYGRRKGALTRKEYEVQYDEA